MMSFVRLAPHPASCLLSPPPTPCFVPPCRLPVQMPSGLNAAGIALATTGVVLYAQVHG